jgi:hypothetical protein
MAQGYDPAKAALYNKLIQDGLSSDAALAQAGISSASFGNYELNDAGQLGKIEIGFGKTPGVNNVTGTAAGKAIENSFTSSAGPVNFNDTGPKNFNDTGAVSASSVKSTSSTTTTTSGGGTTLRVADVGTPTEESKAYEAKANATYGDIKSISRELGPPQFGGNPNLTQEERNTLIAQRQSLYQQYNQDTTASTNALAPSAPAGSVTTPNTTTDTQTTEYATVSTNASVSGASDTQLQQQEIVRTAPDYNAGLAGTDTAPATVSPDADPQASQVPVEKSLSAGEVVAEPVPVAGDTQPGDYTTDSLGNTYKTLPDGTSALVRAAEVAEDVDPNTAGLVTASPNVPDGGTFTGDIFKLGSVGAAAAKSWIGANQAGNQETISNLSQQMPTNTDWRVILRLAPGSTYLYNAADAGLLQPLKVTNGVVFPYTPTIVVGYKATYSSYDLTHSNYRGYFYQNSNAEALNLTATFTAQSTADAAYVLAVIHFFRSVTKMFYGQDAQRGSPPPLVFLSGLGDYQYNNHPCLVQSFNYTLPAEVDYISSGSPNNLGLNLQPLQNLYSTTLNAVAPTATRLAAAFLPAGAQNAMPAPLQSLLSNPTYVPSKLDIQLSLLPVQSRAQVSKQFSLKGFANGQLLKGGFW